MTEPSKKKRKLSLDRFKKTTDDDKNDVLKRRKAQNTNKSTKLWIDCLEDYLKARDLGGVDALKAEDLPQLLETFYVEVRSQKQICNGAGDPIFDEAGVVQYEEYTNNSMRSLRAALNRHFKITLGVNIIDNAEFIRANELFAGKLRINKEEGRGTTKHKQPITDEDIQKLNEYFKRNMAGPPNAVLLQEIVLFNVIFYMGRKGRENLRNMTKETFSITTDSSGLKYIFQQKDEVDKNHSEKDTEMSNQGHIYEIPGTLDLLKCCCREYQLSPKVSFYRTQNSKYLFFCRITNLSSRHLQTLHQQTE